MSAHRTVRPVLWLILVSVCTFLLLAPDYSEAGGLKWKVDISGGVITNPAAGPAVGPDGSIYVVMNKALYSYSPQGSLRWKKTTHAFTTAPTISQNGTIYVGLEHGIVAVAPDSTGLWGRNTEGTKSAMSIPSIGVDGSIYLGTYDNRLYTFSPAGNLIRTFQPVQSYTFVPSPPAVDSDGTYYTNFGGGTFRAFYRNGTEKWSQAVSYVEHNGAAVGKDGTVYSGYPNTFRAYNTDGSIAWALGLNQPTAPAIGADGTIYVGSGDTTLYALAPDGSTKWQFPAGSAIWSAPAIGADGTIYFISQDGKMFAVSPSGEEKWSWETAHITDKHSCVVLGVDGTIYTLTAQGTLFAFEADAPSADWPMFRTPTRRAKAQSDSALFGDTAQAANTGVVVESVNSIVQTAQAVQAEFPEMAGYTPEEATLAFQSKAYPAGANATFSLPATDLVGTVSEYGMYMLQNNGSLPLILTSDLQHIHTPSRWWIAEGNNTVPLGPAHTLTAGTNYRVHFTIQDNGNLDTNATNNTINSKVTFGRFPAAISPDQPEGVTACINNATVQDKDSADLVTTYGQGGQDILPVSQMLRFSAEVSPAGSLAVFRWNSTTLEGNLTTMTPRKYFDADLSYADYGAYHTSVNAPVEGNWWVTYRNNTRLERNETLTAGTNYFINLVIKDNGKYDADPTAGKILDPVVLARTADGSPAASVAGGTTASSTSGGSSSGCMMNPTAGFGLEWLMLLISPLLGLIRFGRKAASRRPCRTP